MRKIIFAPGEFYHIYDRGVEKRRIFMDESDFERFCNLLFFCNSHLPVDLRKIKDNEGLTFVNFKRGETLVDIGAYCLMPNHFHLLLKEKEEKGISGFMQKLMTAYTMFFNKKYQRTGRLFEASFKGEHANDDTYLKYLFAYIHLNPVKNIEPNWKEVGILDKEKVENYLKNYKYSSFFEYSGQNQIAKEGIINKSAFPEYFEGTKSFVDFLDYFLSWEKLPEG